jgi:hypothetical protein
MQERQNAATEQSMSNTPQPAPQQQQAQAAPSPQQTAGTTPKPQIRVTQFKDWASI